MTTRRSFLGAILALGAAPAIVRADSLMRVVPRDLFVEAPPTTGKAILALQEAGAREMAALNRNHPLFCGELGRWESVKITKAGPVPLGEKNARLDELARLLDDLETRPAWRMAADRAANYYDCEPRMGDDVRSLPTKLEFRVGPGLNVERQGDMVKVRVAHRLPRITQEQVDQWNKRRHCR